MVRNFQKKLIVPTVHPVGNVALIEPRGFSELFGEAFLPVSSVPNRPLPKSKYVKSTFGFVNPTFRPAVLHKAVYLKWLSKLSRPRGKHLTTEEYLRSLEILNIEFSPFVIGGISTIEEVLGDVDWDRSPGWPYVNQGCQTKKQAWDKFEPLIRKRVDLLIHGHYVKCNFIGSIKDELLPLGKNARVFLPAPFHHQLACAVLFKKAADSLTATVHSHSSAIGINIFGRGLERALRILDDDGRLPYAYDADQSGCDTSWKNAEPERDFMKNGLPFEYHAGVDMLFNTAMCPRVIIGDSVLQLEMNPSGWYLTTVVNTLMTHRVVASAYMDLSPVPVNILEMRQHLRQLNGGDDLAYATDSPWFTITALAQEVATRGMYLESDVVTPRSALKLTFFSHTLVPRKIDFNGSYVLAACGRLGKIVSSFSFLKKSDGVINWQRNAARLVGLMVNLWPYKREFDILFPYLYHLVHHFFLLDGRNLTAEWTGIFMSIPNDKMMLNLRNGHTFERGFLFSPDNSGSSFSSVKRTLQSALKSDPESLLIKTNKNNFMSSQKQKVKQVKILPKKQPKIKTRRPTPRPTNTNISNVNESSHEKPVEKPKKKGFFAKVGDWIVDHGLETLVTLGSALLLEDHIRAQVAQKNKSLVARGLKDLPEGTIPAGTILASIPIYPNFADSLTPGATTRLSRKASTFLQYKFEDSHIHFTPAAGALNNGQLGFFIASDPRYIITAQGEEVTRLVHEFKGVVTQISQKAELPVPPKKDWLFVEDGHASDTRFTQQGVLWVIAYTDLFLGDGSSGSTTSFGDFSMDYNIRLKDDSIDGAHVSSVSNTPIALYSAISDGQLFFDQPSNSVFGMFCLDNITTNNVFAPFAVPEIVNNIGIVRSNVFAQNAAPWAANAGLFTINQAGYYNFSYSGDNSYFQPAAANQSVLIDNTFRVTITPFGGSASNINLVNSKVNFHGTNPVVETSNFNFTYHLGVGDTIYFSQSANMYDAKTGNLYGGDTVRSSNNINFTISLLLHTSGSVNTDLLLALQTMNGLKLKETRQQLPSATKVPIKNSQGVKPKRKGADDDDE